jgi:hypothetical protein
LRANQSLKKIGHKEANRDYKTIYYLATRNQDNSTTFEKSMPISLCNCIYKIISKFIVRILNFFLSKFFYGEKFEFLDGRQIHKVAGIAQENLHSIKFRNQRSMVIKVDLSKAYDRVRWIYLRIILIHFGFCHQFVVWVMSCIIEQYLLLS